MVGGAVLCRTCFPCAHCSVFVGDDDDELEDDMVMSRDAMKKTAQTFVDSKNKKKRTGKKKH